MTAMWSDRVGRVTESVIGISVTFLALTYVMLVYNALHRRNALAPKTRDVVDGPDFGLDV